MLRKKIILFCGKIGFEEGCRNFKKRFDQHFERLLCPISVDKKAHPSSDCKLSRQKMISSPNFGSLKILRCEALILSLAVGFYSIKVVSGVCSSFVYLEFSWPISRGYLTLKGT